MRHPRRAVIAILLLAGVPAAAERRPEPGPGDPRIQSVLYDANDVVLLEVAPGFQVTVLFSPDERIENVAVGDGTAWQVTPNRRGDNLFVKPGPQAAVTNLVVVTDARTYAFLLSPASGGASPFTVRFRYTPAAQAIPVTSEPAPSSASPPAAAARWRIGGDRHVRPAAIDEDGAHVAITWGGNTPVPAVFAVDAAGRESLVNGMTRDGRFVIDAPVDRLVFRYDRQAAWARRVPDRRRR